VSRVGFAAAIKATKQVGSTLKLDLAQYRELAAFSQFGSDLDKVTLQQLNRGQRLTELLKQPQFQPLPVEKQVVILFAGTQGLLDDVEVSDLRAFEDGFYPYLDSSAPAILTDIATKKALDDDLKSRLTAAIKDYKVAFLAALKDQRDAAKEAAPAASAAPAKPAAEAPQPETAMAGSK
jgi:F-type H+-transporting ATPase subunit alpha